MVKVTCQHSGIEFEANTARTKQHPLVAELKAEANKRGTYREVNEAMDAVRKAGGYTSVEEYIQMVRAHISNKARQAKEVAQRRAERFAQAEADAKAKKQTEDALLKEHGYEMKKVVEAINDDGQGEYDLVNRWYLFSPDGRQVSRFEALDEIRRGMEVVKAERETAQKAAAEKEAADKAEEEAQAARDSEAYAAFDAKVNELTSGLTQVERFNYPKCEVVYKMPSVSTSYRAHDYIARGEINGVALIIAVTGSGYDDDGYSTIYCADPDKAGLTRFVERKDASRFF